MTPSLPLRKGRSQRGRVRAKPVVPPPHPAFGAASLSHAGEWVGGKGGRKKGQEPNRASVPDSAPASFRSIPAAMPLGSARGQAETGAQRGRHSRYAPVSVLCSRPRSGSSAAAWLSEWPCSRSCCGSARPTSRPGVKRTSPASDSDSCPRRGPLANGADTAMTSPEGGKPLSLRFCQSGV